MKRWSKEEELSAIEMLKNGLIYEDIGKNLNRSKDSVKEKLNKLGINKQTFKKKLFCENCQKEIINYGEKYCSRSCSASITNLTPKRTAVNPKNIERRCLNCGEKTKGSEKLYCSGECSFDFRKKEKVNDWLSGK